MLNVAQEFMCHKFEQSFLDKLNHYMKKTYFIYFFTNLKLEINGNNYNYKYFLL